jgi:ankyrin repeat protein
MFHRSVVVAAVLWTIPLVAARAQEAQSQLWDAAIAGDTVAIVRALDAGASVDSLDFRTNRNGRRALNWAAWHNRPAAVRTLVARGATLDATNRTGFTPLHHAAEAGSLDALKALLAAGARTDVPNADGVLPAETATERAHPDAAALIAEADRVRKAKP